MENIQNKINAYKELQEVIKKYPEEFKGDYGLCTIKDIIQRLEISQRFGVPLEYGYRNISYPVRGGYDNWTRVNFIDGVDLTIGCPDLDEQPKDEWLYCISFPCGAYIFGDSYPIRTFKAFFAELKSFGAKYIDTRNSALYFTEEDSKAVYDAFWGIFNKYKDMVADEIKAQRKKELEAELAKLNKE